MATRRVRTPQYKPGVLYATWGREDSGATPDVCVVGLKPDCITFLSAFGFQKGFGGKTLRDELEARGYDLTTLRFSIKKKGDSNCGP